MSRTIHAKPLYAKGGVRRPCETTRDAIVAALADDTPAKWPSSAAVARRRERNKVEAAARRDKRAHARELFTTKRTIGADCPACGALGLVWPATEHDDAVFDCPDHGLMYEADYAAAAPLAHAS